VSTKYQAGRRQRGTGDWNPGAVGALLPRLGDAGDVHAQLMLDLPAPLPGAVLGGAGHGGQAARMLVGWLRSMRTASGAPSLKCWSCCVNGSTVSRRAG
jgi:hypothetical protein